MGLRNCGSRPGNGGRRQAALRGEAAGQVIRAAVGATLLLSAFLFFIAFQGAGSGGGGGTGSTPGGQTPIASADPWSTEGLGKAAIPQRGGLDGSGDVPRLEAVLTPLVSLAAGPVGPAKREPVHVAFEAAVGERSEDGAKAGYGEIGGPDRKIPVLSGAESFPPSAALPLVPGKLKGWGHRFKGKK